MTISDVEKGESERARGSERVSATFVTLLMGRRNKRIYTHTYIHILSKVFKQQRSSDSIQYSIYNMLVYFDTLRYSSNSSSSSSVMAMNSS